MSLAAGARVSPRWLREGETDSISWERRQDFRLENLLGALVLAVSERVHERMQAAAGCSSTAIAALQWVGRGPDLRTCDVAEALAMSTTGASQIVASLIAEGLVQRTRHQHDQRQWRLKLTELGARRTLDAMRDRADLIRELVAMLPFPWRLRLIRILEKLLARIADTPRAVLEVCRHCDWNACRHSIIEPCPVALAHAERRRSNRPA
jgi:DNA-binding MarR family transcriptional regulator